MPTAATNSQVTITDSPAHGRFEARIGSTLTGFTDYVRDDDLVTYPRVVVSRPFLGRGIGDRLVRTALDDARRRGLRVRPACSFVEQWIVMHPEYRDLVVEEAGEGGSGSGSGGAGRVGG
ncbi:GNAT family N-acetyltransferase [Streptomyces chitinivorans]|uniref:GNAT family N-acetyltransferase n=1 Tax=Streptomyces chitinivorans TaxID=1257027 RepID=A0ABW7HRC5_9ACTN|nr:GNAT family N-acetyltransferase [Streptomyces chitinivorans]MDH2407968.1 GNAT family N-acetyltransferase [Streptomyces chitinivorans]